MRVPARSLAYLPLLLLAGLTIAFALVGTTRQYDTPYLLALLNLVFSTAIPLIVGGILFRVHARQGLLGALTLACGLAMFGLASLESALAKVLWRSEAINHAVTIYNLCLLAAAVLMVGSALCLMENQALEDSPLARSRRFGWMALGGTVLLALVIMGLAGADVLPPFFVQGRGSTPVRQVVVLATIVLLAMAATAFLQSYRRGRQAFPFWVSLGLFLLVINLCGVHQQTVFGSALNWTARSAQYLAGVYFCIAAVSASREAARRGGTVEEAIRGFFAGSEMSYRLLVEQSPDVIARIDRNLRYRYVNPAVERLLGLPARGFIGRGIDELGLEGDRLRSMEDVIRQVFEARQPRNVEEECDTPQGRRIFSSLYAPELDADGKIRSVLRVARDITETKLAEKALRDSEEKYRSIFENSTLGIFRSTPEGRYIDANPACAHFLGYDSPRELMAAVTDIGAQLYANPEQRQTILHDLLAGQDALRQEVTYRRKDGGTTVGNLHLRAFRDAAGRITHLEGFVEDITERKRLEEELHRAKEEAEQRAAELDQVLQFLPVAVIIIDRQGNITRVNTAAESLWAGPIPLGVAEPGHYKGWKQGAERRLEPHEWGLARTLREGVPTDEEMEIETFNGKRKVVRNITAPILDRQGEIIAGIAVEVDVTDRYRAEADLRLAKEEADKANQAKSAFLANMSHEIRTPMNGILGMTELTLMEDIPDQAREFLQLVLQSGRSLLDIINDILDLSKIESGKAVLEHKPFWLRECVASTLRSLQVGAREKGLDFHLEIASDLPDHLVGDQGRLRQVLTNLVGNAVKFSERGTVRVSVSLDAPPAGEREVRLLFRVKDDGVGIPRDRLKDVFEAFSQVGLSSHVKFGGTGLGLSISKSLVQMMGGRIWADSTVGKGSTFYFTALFDRADDRDMGRSEVGEPRPGRGVTPLMLLLVEDNRVSRIMAAALLESRGHTVAVAEDGRQALEMLAGGGFEAVLMDVRMPVMDGEEATRRIRSGEVPGLDPRIPIIALTAHAIKGDRERFLASGMDDYIAKPFEIEELDRVLGQVADRLRGR